MSKATGTATSQPAEPEEEEILRVDPRKLKLGDNVRNIEFKPGFVNSIRSRGVRTPIDVYRDDHGDLVVLKGFHRTCAALEAGLPEVRVLVGPKPASNAERIIDQLEENDQRRELTAAERLAAYEQLALEGLSDRQIADRLSEDRKKVKAAMTITRTTHARAAVEQNDVAPTVDQALVLAEFDGDEAAIDTLVAAIDTATFEHVAQQLRDQRIRQTARQKLLDRLTADGLTVTRRPMWDDHEVAALTDLRDLAGNRLTADDHTACPGHAVYLTETYAATDPAEMFQFDYACTDYKAHRHYKRDEKLRAADMTDEQRQASKAERADTVASNRAWASAQTVRREWLATFATRKKPPATAASFIAGSYALADHELKQALSKGNPLGLDLLGIGGPRGYGNPRSLALAELVNSSTEPRAQTIMLVLVLAAYEDALPADAWRSGGPTVARYLTFLADNGYGLSEVEIRACSTAVKPADTDEHAQPGTAETDPKSDEENQR